MSHYPVFNPAIVIDATNSTFRLVVGGNSQTVTIVQGTYYLAGANPADPLENLLLALKVAFDSHPEASTFTFTCTRNTTPGDNGASVSIVSSSQSWYIDVEHAATLFNFDVIGWNTTTNTAAATSRSSAEQCTGTWVSMFPRASDDGAGGGESAYNTQCNAKSTKWKIVGENWRQLIRIPVVDRYRLWTSDKRTRKHGALRRITKGADFEYHLATLSSGFTLAALSTTTLQGGPWKTPDDDITPIRSGVNNLIWSFQMNMDEQVEQ